MGWYARCARVRSHCLPVCFSLFKDTDCSSAAVQIRCFFVAKNTCTLDPVTMRSLHSHIDQLRAIISRCRTLHGFEYNYLDGIQPTWCNLTYAAVKAYRLVEDADREGSLPRIDMMPFVELLQILAPKYELAGM